MILIVFRDIAYDIKLLKFLKLAKTLGIFFLKTQPIFFLSKIYCLAIRDYTKAFSRKKIRQIGVGTGCPSSWVVPKDPAKDGRHGPRPKGCDPLPTPFFGQSESSDFNMDAEKVLMMTKARAMREDDRF